MKKRRLFQHSQIGQSIIILALGFVALVGFVGIVTDVSLLFVRYSTLRRAVDAAAVAAAGQMRRIPDLTPNNGIAEDQASSVASMNLAARSFIEYYGLNPRQVLVETCRAQAVRLNALGRPTDANNNELYLYQPNGERTPNPAANAEVRQRYEELCTRDELKLVRVTAQIDSPTVFLSLLGYPTVLLTETAISQTAVIDVVMVIDVSESMLNETGYDDWETIGQGVRYLPDVVPNTDLDAWDVLLNNSQTTLNSMYAPEAFRPTTASLDDAEPRVECRVRAWPMSAYGNAPLPGVTSLTNPTNPLATEYVNYLASTQRNFNTYFPRNSSGNPFFVGFVPTYNSFGCCNDPNGDWRFEDVICQPFRDARDAANNFLNRLDFIRGDRITYVTFDRSAYIVDPDGAGPQTPMMESQINIPSTNPNIARRGASETLRDVIGVRGEPTFYRDTNNDGYWDAFVSGGQAVSWNDYMNRSIGNIIDHPVVNNCPFDMAALNINYSLIDRYADNTPRPIDVTPLTEIMTIPAWFDSAVGGGSNRNRVFHNYEMNASCAGTNIGAGLRSASIALFQHGRREGAVWIMVFLSDGAAGASNQMLRQSGNPPVVELADRADPYRIIPGNTYPTPLAGEYGGFGLCPEGIQSRPGRYVVSLRFPFCSDLRPETRNFCGQLPGNPDLRPINTCDAEADAVLFYDVDDYARDWADWIGLANLPGVTGTGTNGRVSDQQLPTIFTIGYGLSFERPPAGGGTCAITDVNCRRAANPEDFLGEELLRYIADVGDNFRIDDDYQQMELGSRIPNRVDVPAADRQWGPRGACEVPTNNLSLRGTYMPLDPEVSCGNYFNATDGAALENVFNQIAQRMFTRLSQ